MIWFVLGTLRYVTVYVPGLKVFAGIPLMMTSLVGNVLSKNTPYFTDAM